MLQDNDCPRLQTKRWEVFPKAMVHNTLSLAKRISECASRWCKGTKHKGSYSFISHKWTVGKLLLDPKTPRLLVGFRRDIPGAWDFAQRLRPTIECYSIGAGQNIVPFHMVQADPVEEADEICETMTDFLRKACQWAPSDAPQRV